MQACDRHSMRTDFREKFHLHALTRISLFGPNLEAAMTGHAASSVGECGESAEMCCLFFFFFLIFWVCFTHFLFFSAEMDRAKKVILL